MFGCEYPSYVIDNWRKPSASPRLDMYWHGLTVFFVNDGVSIRDKMQILLGHLKKQGVDLSPLTRGSRPGMECEQFDRLVLAKFLMNPSIACLAPKLIPD